MERGLWPEAFILWCACAEGKANPGDGFSFLQPAPLGFYSVKTWTLETEQWLPLPRETVFAFFADAFNLEALTPPLLRFRVLTPPPITMEAGAIIDYRLSLRRIPVRWRSEITAWQPPEMFVDEQRRGPYRLWRHRHTFIESDGGTLAKDYVEYSVLGGAIVQKLLVAPDLKRIFEYRQRKLVEMLVEA